MKADGIEVTPAQLVVAAVTVHENAGVILKRKEKPSDFLSLYYTLRKGSDASDGAMSHDDTVEGLTAVFREIDGAYARMKAAQVRDQQAAAAARPHNVGRDIREVDRERAAAERATAPAAPVRKRKSMAQTIRDSDR